MRGLAFGVVLVSVAARALAQDAPPTATPPAAPTPPAPTATAPVPEPVKFETDLEAARARSKAEGKPLLLLVVPGWYESPEVKRLDDEVLRSADAHTALEPFVRVRLTETEDREIHVRHRVGSRGHRLGFVLDSDGTFLGSTAGLPSGDATAAWPARVAAIPARARRMHELRNVLAAKPEDPQTLFDLALLHIEGAEPERALALFARMEAAAGDEFAPDRLGEARFHVFRIGAVRAMEERRFGDVEPAALKWLRRFRDHARRAEVLLVQANARFLAGERDRAREVWQQLQDEHPGTDAAKRAADAMKQL